MAIVPAVEMFTDRQPISFTKNGTWQTVSLASIVPSDAKAAIIQGTNSHTSEGRDFRCQGTSQSSEFDAFIHNEGDTFYCVPLNVWRNLKLKAEDSYIDAYAVGALRGAGVVINANPILKPPLNVGEINAWYSRAVSASGVSPDDIEAVIVVARSTTTDPSTLGVRCYGSSAALLWGGDEWNRIKWFPCKVAPVLAWAYYQLYTSGKEAGDPGEFIAFTDWYEVGYILKGYGLTGIHTVAGENPSSVSAWTKKVTSAQVPSNASGMFGMLYADEPADHGLRSDGSSDPVVVNPGWTEYSHGCARAELNASDEYEYFLTGPPVNLYIYAYTHPIAEISSDPGLATLSLTATAALLQAMLTGVVAIYAVIGGVFAARGVLGGVVDARAVLEGVPDAEVVLSGQSEIESVISGGVVIREVLDAELESQTVIEGVPDAEPAIEGDADAQATLDATTTIEPVVEGDAETEGVVEGTPKVPEKT